MSQDGARMFLGTFNNIDTTICQEFLEAWYTRGGAAFVTGQLEKGASGTVHLQYFLHMKTQTRVSALRKHAPISHFTVVKQDNGSSEYCNKEETRIEGPWTFGVRPARRFQKGDVARQNKDLLAMGPAKAVETGVIALKDYPKVKHAINSYTVDTLQPYVHDDVRGIWLWGDSGTGKSYDARNKFSDGDFYEKPQSKWFDGYTG